MIEHNIKILDQQNQITFEGKPPIQFQKETDNSKIEIKRGHNHSVSHHSSTTSKDPSTTLYQRMIMNLSNYNNQGATYSADKNYERMYRKTLYEQTKSIKEPQN
jgi:hypothetical protein